MKFWRCKVLLGDLESRLQDLDLLKKVYSRIYNDEKSSLYHSDLVRELEFNTGAEIKRLQNLMTNGKIEYDKLH